MEITKNMLNNWLEMYKELDRQYDKYDDKLSKYIFEDGKEDCVKRIKARMDKIAAKMDGMKEALEIFGYTVIWQDQGGGNRQYVIVYNS